VSSTERPANELAIARETKGYPQAKYYRNMAYAPHVRVQFGGTITNAGEPNEVWSCSVNVTPASGFQILAYMDEMAPELLAWFRSVNSHCASNASLDYLKVNAIGPDGKYVDPTTTNVHDYSAPNSGGEPPIWPSILTVVTSWRTELQRGPGSRGRIYLPNWTHGSASTIVLSVTDQENYLNAGLALLDVIANTPGGHHAVPVIASNVNATNTPITRVEVGNIVDVQRRRKDAYTEVYVASDWPSA